MSSCRVEVPVKKRIELRLEGDEGLYKCPNCNHVFGGKDFVDIGAEEHAQYVMETDRKGLLSKLEVLLAAGDTDGFRRFAEDSCAMNDERKRGLLQALTTV